MNSNASSARSFWSYASKVTSYLLHPFAMPVYMVLLLFSTGLLPMYVAEAAKRYFLSLVIINTVFIPAMAIILLRMLRIIPDYSLSTRRDRILPLLVVALSYGVCGWLLADVPMIFLLRRCIFAAAGCVVFAFVVNFFWQISLHMTAIGGATGIISILMYGGYPSLVWLLCLLILASGALGSARLYLGKHTLGQVSVGFFGGFVVAVSVMLFSV